MESNPAVPGGLLASKPTWLYTFGCSATSAFFVGFTLALADATLTARQYAPASRQLYARRTRPCERGIAWSRRGECDKAIADFNQALAINSNHVASYGNRGNAWKESHSVKRRRRGSEGN